MMLREINYRQADNLRVTLLWRPDDNTLVVKVDDDRDPDQTITIDNIPPGDATLAFTHPFGYCKTTIRGR